MATSGNFDDPDPEESIFFEGEPLFVEDRCYENEQNRLLKSFYAWKESNLNQETHSVSNSNEDQEVFSYSDLTPENLVDIQILKNTKKTVHKGKFLICRLFVEPFLDESLFCMLEDLEGDILKGVIITNLPLFEFTIGTILCIRDPCYNRDINDCYVVNFNDVVILNETALHWQIPNISAWILSETNNDDFDSFKGSFNDKLYDILKGGDFFFNDGEYDYALEEYTYGLLLSPGNPFFLIQRAECYFKMKKFQLALDDASLVLKQFPNDATSFRTVIHSMSELGRYEEARDLLQSRLREKRNDEIETLLIEIENLIGQREYGLYDMKILYPSIGTDTQLKVADYTGPVEIIDVGSKERGVILTEDVAPGTLLMSCQALISVALPKSEVDIALTILTNGLAKQIENHPAVGKAIYELSAGNEMGYLDSNKDDCSIIDYERLRRIVLINASETYLQHDARFYGLWIWPSYINHDCYDVNCLVSLFGNVRQIRSSKKLKKGDEIFISYREIGDSLASRTRAAYWQDFICECRLCLYEEKEPKDMREKREKILQNFSEKPFRTASKIKKIIKEIKQLSRNSPFADQYLYAPLVYLGGIYYSSFNFQEAIVTYSEFLAKWDRSGGDVPAFLVRAVVCGFVSFMNLDDIENATTWKRLVGYHSKMAYGSNDHDFLEMICPGITVHFSNLYDRVNEMLSKAISNIIEEDSDHIEILDQEIEEKRKNRRVKKTRSKKIIVEQVELNVKSDVISRPKAKVSKKHKTTREIPYPMDVTNEFTHPMDGKNEFTRPMDVKNEFVHPMDVKNEITHPMDVKNEIAHPMDVKNEIAHPMDVKNEFAHPMDVKNEFAHPMDVKNEFARPMDVKNEFARPMDVKNEFAHPMDVKNEFAHPMDVKNEIAHPMDVKNEFAHPMDVKNEFARPMDVKNEIARPMDVKNEIARPMDVKNEFAHPMDVKNEISHPMDVKNEISHPMDVKNEITNPMDVKNEFTHPMDGKNEITNSKDTNKPEADKEVGHLAKEDSINQETSHLADKEDSENQETISHLAAEEESGYQETGHPAAEKFPSQEIGNLAVEKESENQEISHLGAEEEPGNQESVHLAHEAEPGNQESVHLVHEEEPPNQETSHLSAKEDPGNQESVHLAGEEESANQETSHLAAEEESENQESVHLADEEESANQETSHLSAKEEPGNQESVHLAGEEEPPNQETRYLSAKEEPGNQESIHLAAEEESRNQESVHLTSAEESANQETHSETSSTEFTKQFTEVAKNHSATNEIAKNIAGTETGMEIFPDQSVISISKVSTEAINPLSQNEEPEISENGICNGEAEESAVIKIFEKVLESASNAETRKNKTISQPELVSLLRTQANASFLMKEYLVAATLFTNALELEPTDEELLANRAICYLRLENFKLAIIDALECLTLNPYHVKALYRGAKAYIGLKAYDKAVDLLESRITVSKNKDLTNLLHLAKELHAQKEYGHYDFQKFYSYFGLSNLHNIADYVGPIEIKDVGAKGRGIVVTRDLEPGELLLCVQAFACHFIPKSSNLIIKPEENVNHLANLIIDKISKNRENANDLYQLWAGKEMGYLKPTKHNSQIIDVKRIGEIIRHNGSVEELEDARRFSLFILTSYINNDCYNTNCTLLHFGNVCQVRNIKPLKKGDEILSQYSFYRGGLLRNFKCLCEMCLYESREPVETVIKRQELTLKVLERKFKSAEDLKDTIIEIKKLSNDDSPYKDYYIGSALFELGSLYYERKEYSKVIEVYHELLINWERFGGDFGRIFAAACQQMLTLYYNRKEIKKSEKWKKEFKAHVRRVFGTSDMVYISTIAPGYGTLDKILGS